MKFWCFTGHILYFLTGQSEIENALKELEERIKEDRDRKDETNLVNNTMELVALPLYGALPTELQQRVRLLTIE